MVISKKYILELDMRDVVFIRCMNHEEEKGADF